MHAATPTGQDYLLTKLTGPAGPPGRNTRSLRDPYRFCCFPEAVRRVGPPAVAD